MSYLERLKILKGAPAHPTKPTKPPETINQTGFVGFVGCLLGDIQNSHPDAVLVNDAAGDPQRQASNDPKLPTDQPDQPAKQTYQEWAQSWRPLAEAYHAHHFACPTCISAGKGFGLRCGVGASLWTAYAEHPSGDHPGGAPKTDAV